MFLEELTISVNNNNNNVIYCTSLDFGAKKGKIVGFSRFVPATTLTVRSIPRPPPCKIYMRQKSQKAVKKKKKKNFAEHRMVTKNERDMMGGKSIVKTICSICFEDLKPLAQDLQAISVCGHVFHEPWSLSLSLSLSLNIIFMYVSYYIYKCMS